VSAFSGRGSCNKTVPYQIYSATLQPVARYVEFLNWSTVIPSLHDLPMSYELLTLKSATVRQRIVRTSVVRFLYGEHGGDLVGLASLRVRR
jgi:hypothetical protein